MKNKEKQKNGKIEDLIELEQMVGKNIRINRMLLGWTQKDLAHELGISYQQVQKYETGVNRVSASRLFQISNLLGTDIRVFFKPFAPDEMPGTLQLKRPAVRIEGDLLTKEVQAALSGLIKALVKQVH